MTHRCRFGIDSSAGISAATTVNWVCNLLVSFTFLDLCKDITTYGAFWLYAGISLLGLAFFAVKVGATRSRNSNVHYLLFFLNAPSGGFLVCVFWSCSGCPRIVLPSNHALDLSFPSNHARPN